MTCPALFYYLLAPTTQIITTVFYSISCIIAALGNTFCLVVLWEPSQRSKSNKILTSLALSDCLVAYICFPLTIWLLNYAQNNLTTCRVINVYLLTGLWLISCSTFRSIVFIAYERYTFITKSNRYDDILTDWKIHIIMGSYSLYQTLLFWCSWR